MLDRKMLALLRGQRTASIRKLSIAYEDLQPEKINEFAPRKGCYLVQNVYSGEVDSYDLPLAQALWKQNLDDEFDKDFIVEIQLHSFERNPFTGSKELLNEGLINRVIHVKDAGRLHSDTKIGKFVVDWEVLPLLEKVSVEKLRGLLSNMDVLDQALSCDFIGDQDVEPLDDFDY